jgi:micrococcal nuclease
MTLHEGEHPAPGGHVLQKLVRGLRGAWITHERTAATLIVVGTLLFFASVVTADDASPVLQTPYPVVTPTPEIRPSPSKHLLTDEPSEPEPGTKSLSVQRIIDGDTILLSDGRQVRYIGVDTPELSDPRVAGAAREATEVNRRLLEGRTLRLEYDVRKTDKYDRTLAYVWADGVFVNEELLKEGFARLLTIPPDVKYLEQLRLAAHEGEERRGRIWTPAPTVAGASTSRGWDCPSGQPVKGNVSQKGDRIYHVPGGAFYAKTFPEECFPDEQSAGRAGYRESRR